MRLTTRRLMMVIAVAALSFSALRLAVWLVESINDDPFHRVVTSKQSWDVGPEPSIAVDVFEGAIFILPSGDGMVRAEVTSAAVTKISQAAADGAVESIDVNYSRFGDSIRIKARGASDPRIKNEASLKIYVPDRVSLDLRTGRGSIYVGRDYKVGGVGIHLPVVARSIRARSDSDYQLGYAHGNIVVESVAPRGPDGSAIPTRLQLDAPGLIEIVADSAVVEARAWHGTPPKEWPAGTYEGLDEGRITFEGSLAEGHHSFRAAHRIRVGLPRLSGLRVDAEAVGGGLTGDLFPKTVEPSNGSAKWQGSLGNGPPAFLRLRTDDGPIELLASP